MMHENMKDSLNEYFSEAVEKRNCELVRMIEGTEECREINKAINECFEELKKYLPQEKKDLTAEIEDYFTNLLIMYQRYCYGYGFYDAFRMQDMLKHPHGFINT